MYRPKLNKQPRPLPPVGDIRILVDFVSEHAAYLGSLPRIKSEKLVIAQCRELIEHLDNIHP
jgi:hypothetical protein